MRNNKTTPYDSDARFLMIFILLSLLFAFAIGIAHEKTMSSDEAIITESLIKPCTEQGYTKKHCMKVLLEEQSNWFEGHSKVN